MAAESRVDGLNGLRDGREAHRRRYRYAEAPAAVAFQASARAVVLVPVPAQVNGEVPLAARQRLLTRRERKCT